MKVFMTSDTVGGVWTYALELVRSLAPHRVRVLLATMGQKLSDDQRRDVEQIPNLTIAESEYLLEWMTDPWDDVAAAGDWLLDLAESFQPDIVHLNNFAQGALPWNVPVLMVAHSCVLSWHRAVRKAAAGAEWNRYREVVAEGLRNADLIAAPTKAMLDTLEDNYGPLPCRQVIYNGRTGARFPHQCGRKKPQVIAVGRLWDEAKNISAVAEAACRLDWPVRVASLPHPEGNGVNLGGVELLGRLSSQQVAALYAESPLLAHPARYEPFGLVPVEAALAGCALVLGDIETLREVWGPAAVFVDPDDRDQLAFEVNRLSRDSALRRQYAARAFQRAREFTPQRMVRQYLNAYHRLQSLSHPPIERRESPARLGENLA